MICCENYLKRIWGTFEGESKSNIVILSKYERVSALQEGKKCRPVMNEVKKSDQSETRRMLRSSEMRDFSNFSSDDGWILMDFSKLIDKVLSGE